jgi:hypothetical protein
MTHLLFGAVGYLVAGFTGVAIGILLAFVADGLWDYFRR